MTKQISRINLKYLKKSQHKLLYLFYFKSKKNLNIINRKILIFTLEFDRISKYKKLNMFEPFETKLRKQFVI